MLCLQVCESLTKIFIVYYIENEIVLIFNILDTLSFDPKQFKERRLLR